jgi:hypothetical protein
MAQVICDVEGVGVLTAQTLPPEAGGGANPFYDMQTFVTATHGPWQSQDTYRGGRGAMLMQVSGAAGVLPSPAEQLFITPRFPGFRITISDIVLGVQLFAGLGLYFDVLGWNGFVKLPEAQLMDAVPDYMPNHEQAADPDDPDSPMVPVIWGDWHDPSHEPPAVLDGFAYLRLCSRNNSRYIAGTLCALLAADGFVLGQNNSDWPEELTLPE